MSEWFEAIREWWSEDEHYPAVEIMDAKLHPTQNEVWILINRSRCGQWMYDENSHYELACFQIADHSSQIWQISRGDLDVQNCSLHWESHTDLFPSIRTDHTLINLGRSDRKDDTSTPRKDDFWDDPDTWEYPDLPYLKVECVETMRTVADDVEWELKKWLLPELCLIVMKFAQESYVCKDLNDYYCSRVKQGTLSKRVETRMNPNGLEYEGWSLCTRIRINEDFDAQKPYTQELILSYDEDGVVQNQAAIELISDEYAYFIMDHGALTHEYQEFNYPLVYMIVDRRLFRWNLRESDRWMCIKELHSDDYGYFMSFNDRHDLLVLSRSGSVIIPQPHLAPEIAVDEDDEG